MRRLFDSMAGSEGKFGALRGRERDGLSLGCV